MELRKWPESEMEYWKTIEELGGIIWSLNHDLADGRITTDGKIDDELVQMQKIQEKLVYELFEKFGVVHPKDCPKAAFGQKMPDAPFGTRWYGDWYKDMKKESTRLWYENIICSACPYLEYQEESFIPCKLYSGRLYSLNHPYQCSVIAHGELKEGEFLIKLRHEHGSEALDRFTNKAVKLLKMHQKKPSKKIKKTEENPLILLSGDALSRCWE